MDIYKFVNSRDIREYHKKIGYKYTPSDIAWLVYMCEHSTGQEKHEAWRWIIDNMPDEMVRVYTCEYQPVHISLHRVLEEFIEREKEGLKHFTEDEEDKIFFYEGDRNYFSSWNKCYDYINQHEKNIYEWPVCVRYGYIDKDFSFENGYISVNKGGRIQHIQKEELVEKYIYEHTGKYMTIVEFFVELTPSFPSPFKEGDIVYCRGEKSEKEPVVYTCNKEVDGDDSDDDLVYGYVIEDSNAIDDGESDCSAKRMCVKHIYSLDHISDVEYYRGELRGRYKLLESISKWLKGEYGC